MRSLNIVYTIFGKNCYQNQSRRVNVTLLVNIRNTCFTLRYHWRVNFKKLFYFSQMID